MIAISRHPFARTTTIQVSETVFFTAKNGAPSDKDLVTTFHKDLRCACLTFSRPRFRSSQSSREATTPKISSIHLVTFSFPPHPHSFDLADLNLHKNGARHVLCCIWLDSLVPVMLHLSILLRSLHRERAIHRALKCPLHHVCRSISRPYWGSPGPSHRQHVFVTALVRLLA